MFEVGADRGCSQRFRTLEELKFPHRSPATYGKSSTGFLSTTIRRSTTSISRALSGIEHGNRVRTVSTGSSHKLPSDWRGGHIAQLSVDFTSTKATDCSSA